jgi:cytochrome b subunit of formate dehydrogenase
METPVATTAPADSRSGAITYGLLGVVVIVTAIFAISSSFYSNWYAIFRAVHVLVAVLWVGGGVLLTILGLSAERKTHARRHSSARRSSRRRVSSSSRWGSR